MTHSQSGAIGWPIADARPKLVKAIIAAEPSGPPFANAVFGNEPARLWGVTDIPMTYDPPVSDPKQLVVVQQPAPDGPNLERCRLQGEPGAACRRSRAFRSDTLLRNPRITRCTTIARPNISHRQGCRIRSCGSRRGIRGNGHMLMLEKNNLEIASFIAQWIAGTCVELDSANGLRH